MTYDLIAIGESLRDVFYMIDEKSESCILNKERNLLCFEYAEKIPVKQVVKVPAAGNSSNAAVGASRLGLKVALVSWVGKDAAGEHVRQALKTDRVDCRYLCVDEKYPTSEATILNYSGERTQLVYFQPRSYRLPRLMPTDCIYYSAMGTKVGAFDRLLLRELKKYDDVALVFQPGTTHILRGLEAMKSLIARSDLFILNKDEARHLLPDGDRTTLSILEKFRHIGAKTAIITDGANGAQCLNKDGYFHMPIFKTRVVEKTGAGDSFAIGVTVAFIKGLSIQEALRWGAANSASVIGEIGPQKGLLNSVGMKQMIRKFSRVKATRL